ncbi:MAG: hypothetical protein ABH805_00025 [Candidatus Nealsonbacteria bacterium]
MTEILIYVIIRKIKEWKGRTRIMVLTIGRLVDPKDPRVEEIQELLEANLKPEEVDPIETLRETITGKMSTGEEVPPYLVHYATNNEGKVVAVLAGAVVPLVDEEGEESLTVGVLLGCYAVILSKATGVASDLLLALEKSAMEDAGERDIMVYGFLIEAQDKIEVASNRHGLKRLYVKKKNGSLTELPYKQPPVDWNPETGDPADGAGVVPEHLMLKIISPKVVREIPGQNLMDMIRGMFYYNNYREEEYFNSKKAYRVHNRYVEAIEKELTEFIGDKTVFFLSQKEKKVLQ